MEIHGVDQLREPQGGSLYLAILRLDLDSHDAISVPNLLGKLQALGLPLADLAVRLDLVGYRMADTSAYANIRFGLVGRWTYQVDVSFPRIVPTSFVGQELPAGTSRLRYVIDLSQRPPHPLGDQETEAILASLVRAE